MAEISAAGVGLRIPIVGEFHGSSLVTGGGEEHIGVAAFLVGTAADLAQAKHLEEGDRVLQRTDADHGVQILGHWVSSGWLESSRFTLCCPLRGSAPRSTSTVHARGPHVLSSRRGKCSHRSPAGSAPYTRAANIPRSAPRSPAIHERACRVHCTPPRSAAPPL